MAIRTAYEVVMPYHLHMPSYFLGTFTEYPEEMQEMQKEYTALSLQTVTALYQSQ